MKGLECVPALKALSEETRLRILRALSKEPLDVSQIRAIAFCQALREMN